jgi:capsular exopolysaccharide synthesis family protein
VAKLPDTYRAVAQIIVEKPAAASSLTEPQQKDDLVADSWSEDYYNTQMQIMQGPTVLKQVIEELKLLDYFETDHTEALVGRLTRMVLISRIRNSRLFNIAVTSGDPQLAMDVANAVSRAYIRKSFEDSLYYTKEVMTWLPQEGQSEDVVTIQDPFGNIKQVTRSELIENLPAIQTDATIRNLREKKSEQEAELQVLLRQYREKHPIIVKTRAQLKFLEESILAEKKRIIETMKTRAEGTMQASFGRVIEEATLPKHPVGPNRMRMILIIALVEILGSFLVVFLFDHFDDTIHALEDLDRKGILLPFLGPIPLVKGGKKLEANQRALTAYYDQESDITESFRFLRVAINFSASPESLKNLVFTSCLSNEGKSFISHNVAVSLALDGNKTLLIDGDLRRPVVHRNFRLDNATGLSNFLTSNLDFDSVVKPSFVDNLSVVPSGPVSPNPAEILGSQRMKEFLEQARQKFDRIIVDCPPLTAIGDGFVIGNLIGHVVMVISANRTPSDLVRRIQSQLEKAGIKILGVVLNGVDMDKERLGGYSKHYYHTYNRYYRRSNKD